jgi:heme-degrading monooxygenase HmoA
VDESLYTLGIWLVKAGKEDDFIQAWSAFAEWTKSSFGGARSVILLRDRSEPRRFVSVGPWRSDKDVEEWRASEGFRTRVEQLKPMLERFEPGSYTPVVNLE